MVSDLNNGVEEYADIILFNGRIATMDKKNAFVSAVAIKDDQFMAIGSEKEIMRYRNNDTQAIDLVQRTVIPGLNDSHTHLIRGGLNYNLELRWDGVPSLADGLRMLREQVQRTPNGQWVRVIGGWSEFQFAERRMPTLAEINSAAPDTPVMVLHLYARAILNQAALRVLGYSKDTPNPPGGEIQRDKGGHPTGLLIAQPNAFILYSTLGMAPKLPVEQQLNSTRQFMRELNRLGITSVIDAGGGFQNFPDDYEVIDQLHRDNQLTVRIAYNLFTQQPGQEMDDFSRWIKMTNPGQGDDFYRMNGAGEMLAFSAVDFEDFLEPRPNLPETMESDLKEVVTLLAQNRWPFRIHSTYDESITRVLNVYEEVNKEVPFDGMHWIIDHAETISEQNIERIKALGGGIAIQHRMAYQGEYFVARYGADKARQTPPISKMLEMEVPVGSGTDATRVASYNPFVSLYWLVSGKTVGGLCLYSENNCLDRMEALRLWTVGSSWFSGEEDKKGKIMDGQLADLAVLSDDYFSIPDEQIKAVESVLTIVGGKIVYAAGGFSKLAPAPLPVSPDWSPVAIYGGYSQFSTASHVTPPMGCCSRSHASTQKSRGYATRDPFGWDGGCSCFVF
ncbi:MAG: amidohydrolase [Gammaproteobacteria bacterium]|nr:amidohydrolase [Gammaproteobacteria bacterium]